LEGRVSRKYLVGLLVAAFGLFASPADASRVTPMVIDITPTGSGSVARIEVTNTDGRDIPMEIRMYRGVIAEDGQLDLQPADDQFAAFPPQVVIPVDGRQVFRIQFIADAPVTTSEIYYASISQLPVQLEETGNRIQMLTRFNVLVNVVPEGTSSQPEIDTIRWVERPAPVPADGTPADPESQPEKGLEVRIVNSGTRYFPAGRLGWQITGADTNGADVVETYGAADMSEKIGMGIVAPASARVFFIPMERELRDGSVSISFRR
jgi:fimbrial chaperone protein